LAEWIKSLERDISDAKRDFDGEARALADYWDDDAIKAMKVEARTRVIAQEKSAPQTDESMQGRLKKARDADPVATDKAARAEADRLYPPTEQTVGKGKKARTEHYVSHEHIAFTNGALGHKWNLAMPIHVEFSDIVDAYREGMFWRQARSEGRTVEDVKAEYEAGVAEAAAEDQAAEPASAPPGAFPPSATQSPALTEPRPEGGVSASRGTKAAEATPAKVIQDFGEKIEGARKDTFAGFRDSLGESVDVVSEPLSKSFPQPNYEKLAAAGVAKRTLAHIAIMRDMIPNRPRVAYKAKQWAAQVEMLRSFARQLLDGEIDLAKVEHAARANYALHTLPLTAEAIEDVAPADMARAAKYRVNSGSYSMLNGQRYSPSKTFWFLESPDRRMMRNPLNNDPANPYTYRDNPAEAVALAKQIIASELKDKPASDAGDRSKYTDVGVYRDRATTTTFVGFKVRSTVIRLKAGFESVKAAREYIAENRDELQASIDAMRAGPNMRGTENRSRTGEALRAGDVTPDLFNNTFGFRGVQFGNYVEGTRRQADLNRAYDALHDLADVLAIPPQALSLNGSLGLAFGARGHGGRNAAAAHYEPGRVVINLTKGGGPGSLAHEWLHAVDNYFARQDKAGGYMSERRREAGPVRDEVYQAWKGVEATLQKGSFADRSAEFDKARSKPYWGTTIEKAARAFERYIVDRLGEKGAVNDYLANIDTAGGAYPTAKEMEGLGIKAAFDRLFSTIETRPNEGNVELYSVRQAPGLYSAVARAVDTAKQAKASPEQWLATLRNAPGIKPEEMQWLGLDSWLREQKGTVTREQVADYVRANQIQVHEVQKGHAAAFEDAEAAKAFIQSRMLIDPVEQYGYANEQDYITLANSMADSPGSTKFGEYTLPGGENYRELLLTLPNMPKFDEVAPSPVAQERHRAEWDRLTAEINRERDRTDGPANNDLRWALEEQRDELHAEMVRETMADMPAYMKRGADFRHAHWAEPNVLSHIRFNDRTIDGKRTLFIEEVQSDWHQAGKRKGYRSDEKLPSPRNWVSFLAEKGYTREQALAMWDRRSAPEDVALHNEHLRETEQRAMAMGQRANAVPDAPFKTTWPELAMKRMIRYAAENGYDKIAWTPGSVQAERYDLSKQISKLRLDPAVGPDGKQSLVAYDHNGNRVVDREINEGELPDIIGKDVAQKLLDAPTNTGTKILEGVDLKVGGEGMAGFYDKILPTTVNKLVKKYGAKVEDGELRGAAVPTNENLRRSGQDAVIEHLEDGTMRVYDTATDRTLGEFAADQYDHAVKAAEDHRLPVTRVHTIDITPDLRRAALGEGFPMFRLNTAPEAARHRAHLEQQLTEIVRRMVGNRVAVKFEDTLPVSTEATGWGKYGEGKETAAGSYAAGQALIRLAMADPKYAGQERTTAYHEAFHAVEHLIWHEEGRDRAILARENDRLENWILHNMDFEPKMTKEQLADMAGYEIRAIAFEGYAQQREQRSDASGAPGMHIAIARAFEKLLQMLRRIRNFLQGLGYRTAEDVFKDVYEGKVREAADREERSTMEGAAAAADRGEQYSFRRATSSTAAPGRPADLRARIADLFHSPTAKKLGEGIYDLSRPVRELQADLEARRDGTFPDSQDFVVKKRLFPGRRATEIEEFNKNHLDPLIKVMRENNISLAEGALYAYAKHAPERNEAMDARNPALGGAGSGMTNEQAQSVIDRVAAEGKTAAYEEMSAQLARIREFILDTMERGGLEKPEVIQAWRDKYKHYVPLSGFEDAREDAPPNYGPPKGFNIRGKEVHPAFGRRSRADNPIVNLIDQAYRKIDRAEINHYLQSFHLAMSSMGPEAKDIAVRDKGQPRREIDPGTGLVRTVDNSPNLMSPNVVSLKIGGNPVHWVFKNRETAESIKRMSPDGLGMFQFLLDIQNKLKAIWTHYSPDFLVRHFLFRYPIEGTLNSFEQKESGPHSVGTYIKNAIPFVGEASRAIFARNRGVEAGEMGRYYDEMRKAGGAMTFRAMRDMDLIREHLQTQLMSLSGRPDLTIRQKWRKAIEAMDVVTNALDNSLRLAAYASARKQGKTPQQAALIAREATVDFQLKGKWANAIGLWFPFGNVALQTAARMTKAIYRSKIMRRVFMGSLLAGFLTAMYNYLVVGNDKDGVPFFDKVPEWDKRLNFIIMNPFDKDEKGRPLPIKIPMPYNWAMPLAMGYAFGNMAFGSEGVRKSISLITHAMIESLTPFGSEANKTVLLAPELSRPFLHVALNQKFTGAPVHVPAEQANARFGRNVQHGPNSETPWMRPTADQQVGEGWQMIARGVNAASGGSRTKAGALDFYPEDYKEILGYIVGTPLRFGQEVTGTASAIAKGQSPKSTNIPFARVFRGADYDAADRARGYEQSQQNRKPWLAH
jgi:hypothetical protein